MVIMEEISEVFGYAENINVYNGGVKTIYAAGSDNYKAIMSCWNKTIDGAHDMPAYGVGLDHLRDLKRIYGSSSISVALWSATKCRLKSFWFRWERSITALT